MAEIAVHVARVGQGSEKALTSLPEGIFFQPDYTISESAVFKAYHKAMDREPVAEADILRKEDTHRCEDMYRHLQRGITSGDPRSIDAGVRVLAHKAKLNGYAIEPEQDSGAPGFVINIIVSGSEADEQEAIPVSDVPQKLPKS
jgi:hypothetical protein